jgi:ATP-binding cassette, subfamily B, bacterial
VAATLVEGGTRVVVDAGPVDAQTSVGIVLGIAGACAAARVGFQVAVAYLPARIAADIQAWLRTGLFDEFDRATWGVQAEERDGHLQELATSHVVQVTQGLMQAGVLVTSALGFLALLASALFLSIPVALVVIGVSWLLALSLRPMSRRGRQHARDLSTTSMAFAGGVSEAVRVAEETRVFGVSAAQRSRVRDLVGADRSAFLKTKYTARLVTNLYQGLAIAIIVAGLAGLHLSGTGRIAVLGAVVLMLVRSASYGQQAYASYLMVLQAVPFLERLSAAQARYQASVAPAGHHRLDHVRRVTCEHVHYAYARGADALVDVSLDVRAGDAVGIIGPSGAGKSTLVQILLRLREPRTGRFLVNGEPGAAVDQDDWCRLVACVPQDPRLVHGSVRDNISFYRSLSDQAIERAARLAHIHDDVLTWPGGYDAVIGQRADAVSGGQRQRICLARALAGEPELLVLDEPTSALDLQSELLIRESLVALRGRVTIFVVTHRVSMLAVCDRAIVLSNGRIEAFEPTAHTRRRSAFDERAPLIARGGQ